MTNLVNRHPDLALHLSDRTLTPLITSARDQQHHDALASLSHTALHAHLTAQRLGFGKPKRIIVEHGNNGPLILQSFISVEATTKPPASPLSAQHPSEPGSGLATPQHGSGAAMKSSNNHNTHTPTSRGTSTPVPGTPANGGAAVPFDSPSSGISPRQTYRGNANAAGGFGDYIQQGGQDGAMGTTSIPFELALPRPGLISIDDEDELEEDEDSNAPPMLLSIVVAGSADQTSSARRAAAGLERVGRAVQARWTEG
ncbi:hypothetical protein Micbo1qcDRAFT_234302 [Microdochium bolleyi]|uniref:Uncharacterized protein n=1 Tax=Microdochium bolleyi TaxID=196109 RepID=A0A136J1W5_9PEZI|nr:hypothetical protein Micbo1qcDRAFT_234302 [Microdochium bolleyi]